MLFMAISPKTKTKQNKTKQNKTKVEKKKARGLQGVARVLKMKLYIALYDSQDTKYCAN